MAKNSTVSETLAAASGNLVSLGNDAITAATTAQATIADAQATADTAIAAAQVELATAINAARDANSGLKGMGHAGLDLDGLPRMPRNGGSTVATQIAGRKTRKNASSGTRPSNALNLDLTILTVLATSETFMSPSEVEAAVVASGYETSSGNFSTIINQTLGRLKVAHRVKKPARAQYGISVNGTKFLARELAALEAAEVEAAETD